MPTILLAYYCALILVASIIGGMIPVWFQLTHRWMQFAVSFVAGVMLGIGVLHMLPHAIIDATIAANLQAAATQATNSLAPYSTPAANAITWVAFWLLAGMLVMFFIERFFSYHHHDVPGDPETEHSEHAHAHHDHDHTHAHDHATGNRNLSWSGAAAGLALHSVLN